MSNATLRQLLFHLLVFYYIVVNYFLYNEVSRFSLQYFLYVVPVLLFVIAFSNFLVSRYNHATVFLLFFLGFVCLVALLRLDLSTVLTAFLLFSTLIIVINSRLQVSVRAFNFFYVFSIIGSIISFHAGSNPYGYIPNLGALAELASGGPGPRISLYPLVPESAFFSLLIILINYYYNTRRSKYFFYTAGGYFLLFSGSRTALAVLACFIVFELVARFVPFRPRFTYRVLNLLLVVGFILVLNFRSFYTLLGQVDNEVVKALLLREQVEDKPSNIQDAVTRFWIWGRHFEIFAENPVFGVGTYNFLDYVPSSKENPQSSGSESFLTAWLARVGVIMILVLFFLAAVQRQAMTDRNRFKYSVCLFFLIVMISYGSFLVPYNFMFLLIAVSMGSNVWHSAKQTNYPEAPLVALGD